jgi:hypothetical protein
VKYISISHPGGPEAILMHTTFNIAVYDFQPHRFQRFAKIPGQVTGHIADIRRLFIGGIRKSPFAANALGQLAAKALLDEYAK